MPSRDWGEIVRLLREHNGANPLPSVSRIARDSRSPFQILVSTMISLRTKDDVTYSASERLFAHADTPAALVELSESRIAELIYPAGFYRTKAANIREASRLIVEEHGGSVPPDMEALTALPGVGRKTANLVLGQGFDIPSICVDTHVHRIANRCGWVETKTPEQTELALMDVLPREHWIEINELLVGYGQTACTPTSPRCSVCLIAEQCERRGVTRSR
ncbi:MAG: endonuclease III domain-containing protein [Spirochaetota bacterium]